MRDKNSAYSVPSVSWLHSKFVSLPNAVSSAVPVFSLYVDMTQQSLFVCNAATSRNYYLVCSIGRTKYYLDREACTSVFVAVCVFCIAVWVVLSVYRL